MATLSGMFSGGGGQYRLRLEFNVTAQSGNSSYISYSVWVDKLSGSGYYGNSWNISVWGPDGQPRVFSGGSHNFTGGSSWQYASGGGWAGHDGNGNLTYCMGVIANFDSIGTAHPSDGCLGAPRIPAAPGAPGAPSISNITPTTASAAWSGAGRGHADIDQYLFRYHTNPNPDVGGYQQIAVGGGTLSTGVSGLLPGTTYYAKVLAHNADGYGPGSGVTSFTTLPSTPPTLTSVTPDATGKQATLVMAPPSGISSVNSYTIQNRTPGGSWSTVASGSANPTQTVTGLTPGQTYEWRVQAIIGTYTSPSSSTVTRTQPQPNASPGSYFDGDTPDTASTNYQFTGTAGASTSTQQTVAGGAVGWYNSSRAWMGTGGGAGYAYQVAGSPVPNSLGGSRSVRYVTTVGGTTPGFLAGPRVASGGYSEVTVGGQYTGSIWVLASRAITLTPVIQWYTSAHSFVSMSVGAPQAVLANTPTRLVMTAVAPATAARASVNARDVIGDIVRAGDSLDFDGAMVSIGLYDYFDGDTPDTAQFIYGWESAQYTSPSYRETIPQADQNPLLDPDCPPLPVPPLPPSVVDDCIVPVGSWRRTWYQVSANNVPAYLSAVPTVDLSTFGQDEKQVRIRWYPNPDSTQPLDFDASEWAFEQIISYIPPCTTVTIDGVSRRVWAVPGTLVGGACQPGTRTIPADELLYGTDGAPATWPIISCGTAWLVSVDTPLDAPVGNLTLTAELTVRE